MPPDETETGSADQHAPFLISASETTAVSRQHVLKYGDAFAVLDHCGNAQASGPSAEGLYFEDTRYLSRLAVLLDGAAPLLLSSAIDEDNTALIADLTNPALPRSGLDASSIHMLRNLVLLEATLFHSIELRNFSALEAIVQLELELEADFVDLFEVRGTPRQNRGTILPAERGPGQLMLGYRGLDGVTRRTNIAFPDADTVTTDHTTIAWQVNLPPHGRQTIETEISCEREQAHPRPRASRAALIDKLAAERTERSRGIAAIHTDNESFNEWLSRSRADLDMLITGTPHGLYAYAGIPWFSTPFGRDGIITALQCLWLDPELAAGTLRYLAMTQATEFDDRADAEPGKILHETRKGEMAALGEVPFSRYYGSIDATPLFVMLAAAYYRRTGDLPLIQSLWPNIAAAIRWMTGYGDADGDGFLEYGRRTEKGLLNQGWKDSQDSISHADGSLAQGPIALAEVQAYAYEAFTGGALLATALGHPDDAAAYTASADKLHRRFAEAFWSERIGSYVLALDGGKRPCEVLASNAGHVLLSGLATPAHAEQVSRTLSRPEFLTGWGVRTLAANEQRFNPLSYHNGSVWPHDNVLIGMGYARQGLKAPLLRLFSELFDASLFLPLRRLPELYCGFHRRPGVGPTAYPVACIPQAWSSAAVFGILGAALAVTFDAAQRTIRFATPALPSWLEECRITNLRLGDAAVDLLLKRTGDDVAVNVLSRTGDVRIVVSL